MKIAYLVGEFPRLSETFVIDEIREHCRNGIDLLVISLLPPHGTARANLAGLKVPIFYVFRRRGRLQLLERFWTAFLALLTQRRLWCVPFDSRFNRITVLGLAYRLKEVGFLRGTDVLHCHFGTLGHLAATLRALGIIDAKIVTTFHGFDISQVVKRKGTDHYRLLFRLGSLFLPVSEFWAQRLRELGCDPARIKVHHVGVDCALDALRERQLDRRRNSPVKLISIGRLVEKKGHAHTLRALAQLLRKQPDISLSLDIIGDGELEHTLKKEASDLGLSDVVTFRGGLPHAETLALLDQASIFILPSLTSKSGDMEGIPVSLMEAMARGVPVISTYHSGIPELVKDGVSGFLVQEGDEPALTQAIERMIETASHWPEMGRAGRQTIEADFNRQSLSRRLIQYYTDLAPARRSDPS